MDNLTSIRIKERRIALGMTQDDLAIKCGFKSRSSINKIEKDTRNVTIDSILCIANALNTDPSWLLGWTDKVDEDAVSKFYKLSDDKKKIIRDMIDSLYNL